MEAKKETQTCLRTASAGSPPLRPGSLPSRIFLYQAINRVQTLPTLHLPFGQEAKYHVGGGGGAASPGNCIPRTWRSQKQPAGGGIDQDKSKKRLGAGLKDYSKMWHQIHGS